MSALKKITPVKGVEVMMTMYMYNREAATEAGWGWGDRSCGS